MHRKNHPFQINRFAIINGVINFKDLGTSIGLLNVFSFKRK